MQITKIRIENLRALKEVELDLAVEGGAARRRVIFLGANGAGKTTILDALAHVFQSLSHRGAELGAKALGAGDVRNEKETSVTLEQPARRGLIQVEATLSERERRAIRTYHPDAPSRGALRFPVGDPALDDLLSDDGARDVERARQVDPYDNLSVSEEVDVLGTEDPFEGAARAAVFADRPPCILLPADRGVLEYRDDIALQQVTHLDPRRGCLSRARDRFSALAARLALASMGGAGSEPGRAVGRMWKVIEKYFPEMPRHVSVEGLLLWFENGDGSVVPLPALSDGERAVLLIFGEIALRAPEDGVVLIDEVEQHLHPRWQRAVLEGLAAFVPSAQFVFTTQSPYVAASAPDDVVEIGDWKRHGE